MGEYYGSIMIIIIFPLPVCSETVCGRKKRTVSAARFLISCISF